MSDHPDHTATAASDPASKRDGSTRPAWGSFGAAAAAGLVLAFVIQWSAWYVLDGAGAPIAVIAAVSLGGLLGLIAALQWVGRRTVGSSPIAAIVAFVVPNTPFVWFLVMAAQFASGLSD